MNDPNSPQYSASSSQPSELRSNSVSPSSRFMSAPGRARMGSSSDIPHPVNFRQTLSATLNNGDLYFEYEWESSTGRMMDLFGLIYEEVIYPGEINCVYYPPNPPFATEYLNPTISWIDASRGKYSDTHYCPKFSQPYQSSSFSAKQRYYYEPASDPGIQMNLMEHLIIHRNVSTINGKWVYQCSKSGITSHIDLPNQALLNAQEPVNLNEVMHKISFIQPGVTRETLELLFRPAEGLATPMEGIFQYRECELIYLQVQFEANRDERGVAQFGAEDKIVKLSRPFLDSI